MFGRLVFWPAFSSYFFTFFRTIFLALASTGSFVISKSKIPAKAKTIAVKTTVPPNSTSLPRPAKKADVAFLTRIAGIAAITEGDRRIEYHIGDVLSDYRERLSAFINRRAKLPSEVETNE